jgi:threonyl-tRNA synthetase
MRVRCFYQDDAHIFMTNEQIKDEIKGVAELIDKVYKTFGFEYHIELSTQPEDSMGSKEDWDRATNALKEAITEMGRDFEINEGDGAFYGPKLDFHLKDCLGRTWQCGTIQLDFQMPERFDLEYVGADNKKYRPIMVHRVAFGSIERFLGILTEHFAGAFPMWLAPVQAAILPITDRQNDYAAEISRKLEEHGIRCTVDSRNEKIGYKIREHQTKHVPYMLVIGDKEAADNTVAVRQRNKGDQGVISLDDFVTKAVSQIKNREVD